MEDIPRTADLSEATFVDQYLVANRPVILTDVATAWQAQAIWTPQFLLDRFGDQLVQVYDQLFSLIDLTDLSDYLERNFGKGQDRAIEYVRWYSQLSDVEVPWSDEIFDSLARDWEHPGFLPRSGFVLPFCQAPDSVSAPHDLFPYRGIFISPQGGRTRLHRDPLGSQAILWQVYGRKNVTFYPPYLDEVLRSGCEFVDPLNPDLKQFPRFPKAEPVFNGDLGPGEILFIPDGWFHDVVSITDSISVTWNFVHSLRIAPFIDVIAGESAEQDFDVAQFFLSSRIGTNASRESVFDLLKDLGLMDGQFGTRPSKALG